MKRILITGKNSYIGNALEKRLLTSGDNYSVDQIGLRDSSWEQIDFGQYSVVIHLAGIAHLNESVIESSLYYSINRDLAVKVAEKAKNDGIKHFVFMSTMSVYGILSGVIDQNSPMEPITHYGTSKYEAEELLKAMENDQFHLATLRPPMVYGKNCKGNYPRLANFVKKYKVFPNVDNERSMIYIDNLVESLKLIIDFNLRGTFFPQNINYIQTKNLAKMIGLANNIQVISIPNVLNIFNVLSKYNKTFNKVAGSLVYDKQLATMTTLEGKELNYNIVDFEESIKETERE